MYTYAQQIPADTTKNKEYYIQKAKSQKTTAWILLGGGLALTIGGTFLAISDYEKSSYSDAGPIMFITGLACQLGSIPFFVIAHNNKRKALELFVGPKMEKNDQIVQMYVGRYQPAISLKINLK